MWRIRDPVGDQNLEKRVSWVYIMFTFSLYLLECTLELVRNEVSHSRCLLTDCVFPTQSKVHSENHLPGTTIHLLRLSRCRNQDLLLHVIQNRFSVSKCRSLRTPSQAGDPDGKRPILLARSLFWILLLTNQLQFAVDCYRQCSNQSHWFLQMRWAAIPAAFSMLKQVEVQASRVSSCHFLFTS